MSAIRKDTHAYDHPVGLMDFAHEVEQKTKYLTYSKDRFSKWVYSESDSFPMGYIAYKDIRENASYDDDPKYLVYSPNIHNGKYSYGDRMYSAQATTMEKGVKNAVTYLRALTVPQVVDKLMPRLNHVPQFDLQSIRLVVLVCTWLSRGMSLSTRNKVSN